MRFSNSEKPIIPLGILDILGCRNRLPKVFENCITWTTRLLFFVKSSKYGLGTNTKWMPFPNPEKPIIPLGILDILGCRNHLPKVFENCTIWTTKSPFSWEIIKICFIKPIPNNPAAPDRSEGGDRGVGGWWGFGAWASVLWNA